MPHRSLSRLSHKLRSMSGGKNIEVYHDILIEVCLEDVIIKLINCIITSPVNPPPRNIRIPAI